MAVFGGMILTNKGLVLQGKAQAGAQLTYTRIAIGDGSLSGQAVQALNALISQKKNLPVLRLKVQPPNKAIIGSTLSNAYITSGFYFREVGVFAQDPDAGEILYAYANAGVTADYIAPGGGSDIIEKDFNCVVVVGAAVNVTATIDETLVYVTQQQLDEALEGIVINDASLTQKGVVQLSSAIDSDAEDMAATPKAVKAAFQAGNERKAEVVAALVAIGVTATTSDTWPQLISKISAVIRGTGDAVAGDVRAGKIFSSGTGNNKTGTLTVRATSAVTVTPSASAQVLNPGIYDSTITIPAVTFDASKVLTGTTIAGKAGTMPRRTGSEYTGYERAQTAAAAPGRIHLYAPLGGYVDATADQGGNHFGVFADDPDFVAANFRSDVNVFGLQGGIPLANPNISTHLNASQSTYGNYSGDGQTWLYLGVPRGYLLNGVDWVRLNEPNLNPYNFRAGYSMFGGQLVGTLIEGKRSASGTMPTNGVNGTYTFTISGLNFTPSVVLLSWADSANWTWRAGYNNGKWYTGAWDSSGTWQPASNSIETSTINSAGFTINRYYAGQNVYWTAIE